MTTNFRKTSANNGEIRLASPSDVTHTLRVVVTTTPKVAGAIALVNNRLEVIENIQVPVTQGSDTAKETVSIRTVVSGSTLSEAAVKAALTQHQVNVMAIANDKGLQGFIPEVVLVVTP